MKNFKKILFVAIIALTFLFASIGDVVAKGSSSIRSGGGGFSRPSKPSSVAPSKPSPSKPSSVAPSKPSTSTRSTSSPTRTPAQQKSYEAAKQNGTAFKSKSEAVTAFKQANATKYTSKYATEPSTRPTYIPQTTSVGGTNVNISYNASMGGYGYMHPSLGTFMLYDALSDAAMVSVLMSHDNYYYEDPNAIVATHRGISPFALAACGAVLVIMFIAIVVIIGNRVS